MTCSGSQGSFKVGLGLDLRLRALSTSAVTRQLIFLSGVACTPLATRLHRSPSFPEQTLPVWAEKEVTSERSPYSASPAGPVHPSPRNSLEPGFPGSTLFNLSPPPHPLP